MTPTPAPPWAVTAWADATTVYVQLPAKPGAAPHILTFAATEAGLSKALNLMRTIHHQAPGAKPSAKPKALAKYTPAQRDLASEVLRNLRMA